MTDRSQLRNEDLFSRLGGLLIADYDLESRNGGARQRPISSRLASEVWQAVEATPLVYTAFDGDHQYLSGYMRAFVMKCGGVPANPESILGYKETVDARLSKVGVLYDDLAILSSCNEIWIFTEHQCCPSIVRHLAEGVVIELLYFLKTQPASSVFLVSPSELLRGEAPTLRPFDFCFSEVSSYLSPQQSEILAIVERASRASRLRALVYHIIDPMDFKYARWVQGSCYNSRKAPILPSLAVDLRDVPALQVELGHVVGAWARLMSLAARAYVLPSISKHRSPSGIAALLVDIWEHAHTQRPLRAGYWRDYRIPRAQNPETWAITTQERKEASKFRLRVPLTIGGRT